MLPVTQCEKRSKSKEGMGPVKHSENQQLHWSLLLTAHLAESKESVQAVAVCTYAEKKPIMPNSPFPLLDGLHYAHLLRAVLTFSGPVALLFYSSTGRSNEP